MEATVAETTTLMVKTRKSIAETTTSTFETRSSIVGPTTSTVEIRNSIEEPTTSPIEVRDSIVEPTTTTVETRNSIVETNNPTVETRNDTFPLPTDSMVTVRLSDVKIQSAAAESARNSNRQSSSLSSRSSTASTGSLGGSTSPSNTSVDWEELEKTEEQEPRCQASDESTALLLARLEQENAALAINPKSGHVSKIRARSNTRPPSIQQLQKLVNGPQRQSLRYSLLPAPPMTELEFWAALVSDYPQTAQRLPTLTSNKIRGGVPPPLRGVVWASIAGARDSALHEEFQKLCGESSPYEGLIGKDVGRSFPNVEMFREKGGEGQEMLGRVLKCFSLHDQQIGYCQGLGFVVGPLLMHMSDVEAFCVLVRLMEHYDLRSCYLPDLGGLHLRIYQFQILLGRHLPELAAHLDALKVEPLYVSQWFLSFFAVTCPLPMLLRIYDVILAEGATETLMRVALSLMSRNQKKIMACTEFEDVMQFLLSRGLWDTYAQRADDLVTDFVSLTGLVSRESLQSLEIGFKESQTLSVAPSLRHTASQLLGRFWAGSSHVFSKSGNNLSLALPRAESAIRRPPSKQSLTSTLNSSEDTSDTSTLATEVSSVSRQSAVAVVETINVPERPTMNAKDRDLHNQIEDLLTALNDMQRQQADLARDLQREREEREEDRKTASSLLESLRGYDEAVRELAGGDPTEDELETHKLMEKAAGRFSTSESKRVSIMQTKHQLRDAASEWKQKHNLEAARCQNLTQQLDQREVEHNSLKNELRLARSRIQDGVREKERLERTIGDLRNRRSPAPESPTDWYSPSSETTDPRASTTRGGLRELKLGRVESVKSQASFGKRGSSLGLQTVIATENHQPVAEDALLLELVNAKTAEAVARQELEEVKGKLDTLRKMMKTGGAGTPPARGSYNEGTTPGIMGPTVKTPGESPKGAATPSTSGGFFSGWGKKAT